MELKDRELKERNVKIKTVIKELFLNRLLCLYMTWRYLNKKKWRKWGQLINYISEPITKIVGDPKEIHTPKQTIYGRGKKLSKPKAQN